MRLVPRPAPLFVALLLGLAACGRGTTGDRGSAYIPPIAPDEAPLVTVETILEADSLIGRRVRVAGACALAGTGPSTGVWVLLDQGFAIEVRGLVPRSCFRGGGGQEALTIFAQIEPKGPESAERLLLRLPE